MAVEVVRHRESMPARAANFYHEVVAEMRKVTWPTANSSRTRRSRSSSSCSSLGRFWAPRRLLQLILVQGIPSLFSGR